MKKIGLYFGGALFALLLAPVLLQPPRQHIPEKKHTAALGRAIDRAVEAYREAYEELPTGTNEEIFATLRGDNPRQMVFLDCAPEILNDKGELVDAWGRAFQILINNKAHTVRITSAGADGVFGGAAGHNDDYDSARDVIGDLLSGKAVKSPLFPF